VGLFPGREYLVSAYELARALMRSDLQVELGDGPEAEVKARLLGELSSLVPKVREIALAAHAGDAAARATVRAIVALARHGNRRARVSAVLLDVAREQIDRGELTPEAKQVQEGGVVSAPDQAPVGTPAPAPAPPPKPESEAEMLARVRAGAGAGAT